LINHKVALRIYLLVYQTSIIASACATVYGRTVGNSWLQ